MKPVALVVEDNPEYQELLQERMLALGHTAYFAASLQTALELLDLHIFDYALLDLCIPTRPGQGLPLPDTGEELLEKIIAHPRQKGVPIIIWTSHGLDNYVLAARLMQKGAFYFLGKDSESFGLKLNDVIRQALASRAARTESPLQATATPAAAPAAPALNSPIANQMIYYPERIELWGIKICGPVNSCQSRDLLDVLRITPPLGGSIAAKILDTTGQNLISQCVMRFRQDLGKQFAEDLSWPCKPSEVLLSRGPGFRINPAIELVDRLGGTVPKIVLRARKILRLP